MHRNTLGKFSFISLNFSMILIFGIIFYDRVFIRLPGMNLKDSLYCLCGIIMIIFLIGVVLEMRYFRNYYSIAFNTALPLALYSSIAYFGYAPWIVSIFNIGTLIILGIIVWAYLPSFKKVKNTRKWKKLKNKMVRLIIAFLAYSLSYFILILLIFVGIPKGVIPIESSNKNSQDHRDQLEAAVLSFKPVNWNQLDEEKKLESLNILLDHEVTLLGMKSEVHLSTALLPAGRIAAYDYPSSSILVSQDSLSESGWSVVMEMIHELYHLYQHEMVDVYDSLDQTAQNLMGFDAIKDWKLGLESLENDIRPNEYGQSLEEDAEYYGMFSILYYDSLIENESPSQEEDPFHEDQELNEELISA